MRRLFLVVSILLAPALLVGAFLEGRAAALVTALAACLWPFSLLVAALGERAPRRLVLALAAVFTVLAASLELVIASSAGWVGEGLGGLPWGFWALLAGVWGVPLAVLSALAPRLVDAAERALAQDEPVEDGGEEPGVKGAP